MISFGGVDTSMAILTIDSVNDADIPLGTVPSGDESIEIAPLCVLDDPKNPKDEYITDVPIVIVAASAASASAETETETDKTDESATATTDNNDEVVVTNTEPVICTVTLKVTYKPSAKDQREELYDLLNKTSQRKATALSELRKLSTTKAAAAAASSSSTAVTKPSGVKSGFLNKGGANKKSNINDEENNNNKGFVSKVKNWYGRFVTGPESIVMKTAFWGVVTKDFWIFFGAVGFFHFNGHVLALPPPV